MREMEKFIFKCFYRLEFDVRQGSVLSPFLFAVRSMGTYSVVSDVSHSRLLLYCTIPVNHVIT